MMRILVWDKTSLGSSAARILKRLHCVFDVPLFWVDASTLPEHLANNALDFHLVWDSGQPTALPAAWSVGELPDSAVYLNEKTGTRMLANAQMRTTLWATVCELAEMFKSPGSSLDQLRIEN